MKKPFILALSGSLREGSTNTALLEAARLLAPPEVDFALWNEQASLVQFTPDLEASPPVLVQEFRSLIGRADGLIIACPEYARGVPGAFKNALDWLVGDETFVCKKFALWNGSPRAHEAQKSLRLVLETMSGIYVEEAALALPLMTQQVTPHSIATNTEWASLIEVALAKFAVALGASPLRLSGADETT